MKRINRNRILLLVFLTTCIFIGINILQNFTLLNSTNEYLKNDEENTLNNLKTSGYWSVPYIHIKNDNWSATSVPWIQNRTGTWNDPHIIENVITTGNIGGHCILIEDSTDFFIIRNCTAVTSGTAYTNAGIKLDTTNNGALIDNNCSSNNFGIFLVDSNNNTISGNIANDNTEFGILLDNSEDNIISSGTIENNRFGIELNSGSDHNDVTENYIYNNVEYGLYIYFSGNPPFNYDGYNNVWKNVIKSNGKTGISPYGIQIRSSSKNVIWENIIEDNDDIGIGCASFSSENLIYKNYFIGNSLHANDVGSNNNWDNSIIGNYWDNYTGSDSDGDGIGDSPYTYITGSANSNDTLPIYGDPFHDGSKVYINGNLDSGVNSWNWTSTRAWCSGSGLSGDPYIISDLVIDGGGSGSCITIGNSTVYFEIENCTVYKSGTGSTDAGIKLIDVDNSKLLENNCSINKYGIYLELSDKNDILENFLGYNEYGLYLNNSNNNYIAENTFKSNTQNAFEETSSGNTFENNYVLPPTKVYNVDSPQSDIPVYRLGDTIEITIEFSDIVYVTGTPQLTLETGDDDAIVNYVSGSGTTTLSFNYTVGLDHYSTDLDYTSTNALSGTIKGVVGNDADLTLPAPGSEGSLGYNKDFVVDAKTPSVSDVSSTSNGIFNVGANIDITITFTEAVFIVVTPELTLETNTMPNGVASYSSGNGTAALTFTYTVAAGHATTDLDYESTTALSGTLEDSDGLSADLTLPTPGTAGSLGANNNIIIDTIDPSSPTGLSASPSSWTNIDDFDLSWTNPADTSGIVGAYYKLDTAPGSDTDGTYVVGADIEAITGIAVGSEGSHTIYVWLRDAAGNINYLNDATTVVYLDT
ncbi:MAG: NosD domain-containing protein, partial [Promethearchaeota archaeon]